MSNKNRRKQNRKLSPWIWGGAAAVLVAVVVIVIALTGKEAPDSTQNTVSVEIENTQKISIDLGNGMSVTEVGSYTGAFVEDGSNEIVSKVLMAVVTNNGSKTVQYADFGLTNGEHTASFKLSTLPPGASVVVLEQTRMSYADGSQLNVPVVNAVVLFPEEPSLCQDQIQIQELNGALNITNISGEDITGNVIIYYKNISSDMLYGGITYRVVLSGGLKKGEVKQGTAAHFSTSGSRIMFVTCG